MLAACHVDSGLLGSQPHVAMGPPTSKAGGEKKKMMPVWQPQILLDF